MFLAQHKQANVFAPFFLFLFINNKKQSQTASVTLLFIKLNGIRKGGGERERMSNNGPRYGGGCSRERHRSNGSVMFRDRPILP